MLQWLGLLAVNLIMPVLLIIFGILFKNEPPREINKTFGYRTKLSMKNQKNWDLAQKMLGKIWFKLGIFLLIVSGGGMLLLLIFLPKMQEPLSYAITAGQLIVVCVSFLRIQKVLKSGT